MEQQEAELNPSGNSADQQGSVIPLGWKPTAAEPVPVIRCTQIKRDGERCKRWSLRGYEKCYRHSGSGNFKNVTKYTEAVVEGARLRLIGNTEQAIDVLEDLMQVGTAENVRLKAATEVLDRAGVRGGFEVQIDAEVTLNPADAVKDRLAKLAAGAAHVEQMRANAQADNDNEIVDAEIVDDGQDTLF